MYVTNPNITVKSSRKKWISESLVFSNIRKKPPHSSTAWSWVFTVFTFESWTHHREQESFIRFCTKSQDLDLLQKQPKKKWIPPCWCQQRSSEELKGLSLPLPSAQARHLPLAQGHGALSPEARREHDTPAAALTNTCPPQSTAKRQKEGFPSWGLEKDTV